MLREDWEVTWGTFVTRGLARVTNVVWSGDPAIAGRLLPEQGMLRLPEQGAWLPLELVLDKPAVAGVPAPAAPRSKTQKCSGSGAPAPLSMRQKRPAIFGPLTATPPDQPAVSGAPEISGAQSAGSLLALNYPMRDMWWTSS